MIFLYTSVSDKITSINLFTMGQLEKGKNYVVCQYKKEYRINVYISKITLVSAGKILIIYIYDYLEHKKICMHFFPG